MKDSKELTIVITGSKIEKNSFPDYKKGLLAVIDSAVKTLETDEDFAEAEKNIKAFSEAENILVQAKEDALSQTKSVAELLSDIDDVKNTVRDARLALNKQVTSEKKARVESIVQSGADRINATIGMATREHPLLTQFIVRADENALQAAVKGKKKLDSMAAAVKKVVDEASAEIDRHKKQIDAALDRIGSVDLEYASLFQDTATLVAMDAELLSATIEKRITQHKLNEADRKRREEEAAALAAEAHGDTSQGAWDDVSSAPIPQNDETAPEAETQPEPENVVPISTSDDEPREFLIILPFTGTLAEARDQAQKTAQIFSSAKGVGQPRLTTPQKFDAAS